MFAETLSQETLAMAAGALLSLAFSYIPGLGARYAARILYDLVDRSLAMPKDGPPTKCAQPLFVSSFFIFVFIYSLLVAFSDEFPDTLYS